MGDTEGVARDVLFKVRRRREARETHCLAEEHRGFVERFLERGEREAKKGDEEKGRGKAVENAERAVFNVERAAERVKRALREKEGVFAFGRTEGVKRGMKVIGKVRGRGSGEAKNVDGDGKRSETEGVEEKGKGKKAEEIEGEGKGRKETVEDGKRENAVGEKPEEQRAEPEVKKPTYAMMLRNGEGSNSSPSK